MRQKLRIIIGIVSIAVVLVAAVIVLTLTGGKKEAEPSESVNIIDVINVDKANISEIRIMNSSGEFSFVPVNDKFCIKGRENYLLIDYQVDALVNNLTGFKAYKSFPAENGDLSIYGLENPEGTAEILKKDGTSVKLLVGKQSPTGSVYTKIADSDTVYIADRDKGEPVLRAKLDYYNTQITAGNLDTTTFASYSMTNGGKTIAIRKRTTEEKSASSDIVSDFIMTSPYNMDADPATITGSSGDAGLISRLASLTAYSVVSDEATSEVLKKFSLTNPAYILNMKFDVDTTLYFSDMTDDGYYYARRGGEDLIYKVEAGMAGILNYDTLAFMNKDLYMLKITELKSLTVSFDGNSHTFNISNNTSEFNEDMKVQNDGKELPQNEFRTFYQNILSVDFNGLNAKASGTPYLSMKFSKSDGTADTVEFYQINDIDMCAVVNGGVYYKVTKIAVDRIKSDCTDYINGQDIKIA